MGYVHIIECADGTYYVGSTTYLEARLWQHQHGPHGAAYTRHRRPVKLVWCGEFESVAQAFAFETASFLGLLDHRRWTGTTDACALT